MSADRHIEPFHPAGVELKPVNGIMAHGRIVRCELKSAPCLHKRSQIIAGQRDPADRPRPSAIRLFGQTNDLQTNTAAVSTANTMHPRLSQRLMGLAHSLFAPALPANAANTSRLMKASITRQPPSSRMTAARKPHLIALPAPRRPRSDRKWLRQSGSCAATPAPSQDRAATRQRRWLRQKITTPTREPRPSPNER